MRIARARHRGLNFARPIDRTRRARGSRNVVWQIFREFLAFVKQEKKWWLVPLATILLLIGALVVFASGSALAPFIYPFI